MTRATYEPTCQFLVIISNRGGFRISSRGWQRYLQGVAKKFFAAPLSPQRFFCFHTHYITNLRPLVFHFRLML